MSRLSEAIDFHLSKLGHGSVVALADVCGVSHSTVGSWRRGDRMPRPQRWRCIENFLVMEPGTIFTLVSMDSDEQEFFI